MDKADSSIKSTLSTRLEGKTKAIVVCWFLGLGALVAWNSMLTIGDYYYQLFPRYHPSRVLTLVYQPFALGTMAIFAYYEAKIDTRKRNLFGYILFCINTFGLLVIDLATSGKGGIGNYIGICAFVAAFGVADALVQGGLIGDLAFMCPEFLGLESPSHGIASSQLETTTISCTRPTPYIAQLQKSYTLFRFFLPAKLVALVTFSLPLYFEFCLQYYHPARALPLVFQPFALRTLAVLAYNEAKIDTRKRNLFGYVLFTLSIFGLLLIDLVSSGKGGLGTFVGVCICVAGFGISTAHVEGGVVGELSVMCPQFVQSFSAGVAASGALTSCLRLIAKAAFDKTHNGLRKGVTMFNIWDLISRYIPLADFIKLESRKALFTASLLRILFVPCFYFTAKYGDQGWMITLVSLLGLTNGYLTEFVFLQWLPKDTNQQIVNIRHLQAPEQNALGNLLVAFLVGGVFTGVCLSWLWINGHGKF
ncbi:equilibrative nucleoside transporter [Striga asiatica]|uniref:Equilibrative nucleoside transporter n=1 Tax=Striga asiatica TaxID=4170 RepID=A0A5A7PFI8_STRAF|nr:equilibrative nucleoside transporter [Striga asiatica]